MLRHDFIIRGIVLAFSLLFAISVQAQSASSFLVQPVGESEAQTVAGQAALCFRGRPLSECRSFLITEAEVGYVVLGPDVHSFPGFLYGMDVGWMRNLSPRDAVGIVAGASNRYVTLGPRYRRWLTDKAALDVGLSAAWEPGRIEIVELHTAVMFGDRIGLWTTVAPDLGQGQHALALGVRVGAEPGVITYAAAATTTLVILVGVATGVIVIST